MEIVRSGDKAERNLKEIGKEKYEEKTQEKQTFRRAQQRTRKIPRLEETWSENRVNR